MIEKLLSFTITESMKNEINKQIGSHCFDSIHTLFNEMIRTDYLFYDREDYKLNKTSVIDESLGHPPGQVFYNNKYYGQNEWNIIPELVQYYKFYKPKKT
jgi:hypothetical protein